MSEKREVDALRHLEAVLSACAVMLHCNRRGLCLFREWTRHYGTAGTGCLCYARFTDRLHAKRAAPPLEGDYDE